MSKIARRWMRRITLAGFGTMLTLAALTALDAEPAHADDRPVVAVVSRVTDVVERVLPDRPDRDDRGHEPPPADCPDPPPTAPPTPAPAPDRQPRPEPTPGRDEQPADEPTPTPEPEPSKPAEEPTQRPTPPTPTPPPVIDLPPIVVDIPPVTVPPVVVVPPIVVDVPPIVVDLPPIIVTPTPPAEQPPAEQPPAEVPPVPAWPIPIPLPGQGTTTPTTPAAPDADHPAAAVKYGPDEYLVEDGHDDDRAAAADTRLCPSRQRASGPPRTVRPAPPRTDVDRRPDGCPGDGHTVWESAPQGGGVHQPRGSVEFPVDLARQAAVAGPPAGHLAVAGARAHLPLGRTTHLDPRPA